MLPSDPASPPSCPGCRERDRRIVQLEAHIVQLEARVAQLEHRLEQALRQGRRQAAPFAKGPPKAHPKPPGRKAGDAYGPKAHRPPPPRIDEVHTAPLPCVCPHCGSANLQPQAVREQYQVEIPRRAIYRRFDIHCGRCRDCHRSVHGRHELQTSDATGCCGSQLGPQAQALAVLLNKDLGLSHGKIAQLFGTLWGIALSRGGSAQAMLRSGRRGREAYRQLLQQTRQSPWTVIDDTGWKIGGRSAWLQTAVSPQASVYRIERRHDWRAVSRLLGRRYGGTLIHDGARVYDWFAHARHQTCLTHLLRRCRSLQQTLGRKARRFARRVQQLLQEGLGVRDQRRAGLLSEAAMGPRVAGLHERLERLIAPRQRQPLNERLARFLRGHVQQVFLFLREPVDAGNWRAEQAIRPAVVNRKVWGGSRTYAGAKAQETLMSLLRTLRQRGQDALQTLGRMLQSSPPQRLALLDSS